LIKEILLKIMLKDLVEHELKDVENDIYTWILQQYLKYAFKA